MSNENNNISTWDFVEKYYPNYYSSDRIAEVLDLANSINIQEDANKKNKMIDAKKIMLAEIYKKSIQAFLKKQQTTASIVWSVNDFEVEAERQFFILKEDEHGDVEGLTSWDQYFDKSKFKMALDVMIEDHDAEYGINNYSVQNALETYCIF